MSFAYSADTLPIILGDAVQGTQRQVMPPTARNKSVICPRNIPLLNADGHYWGSYTNADLIRDGNSSVNGARVVSYIERLEVLDSAWQIFARIPKITWVRDQAVTGQYNDVSKSWERWDGTIDHIGQLRCDGLVEIAYESNWINVWGRIKDGGQPQYNIMEYLDDHNKFTRLPILWYDTLMPATQINYGIPAGHRGVTWQTTFAYQPIVSPVLNGGIPF